MLSGGGRFSLWFSLVPYGFHKSKEIVCDSANKSSPSPHPILTHPITTTITITIPSIQPENLMLGHPDQISNFSILVWLIFEQLLRQFLLILN